MCFYCMKVVVKWLTQSPFVQSEEGVLLSVFICMFVCVLNDPWGGGAHKHLIEGAGTDGRTGRLSDRHRGLRLQCSRRHVSSIPFHVHKLVHFLSLRSHKPPTHDAALLKIHG